MPKCSSMRDSKLYVQTCCNFLCVTIAYQKWNSEMKDKFLHRNKKNLFFGSKIGVDLYTELNYTWMNIVGLHDF